MIVHILALLLSTTAVILPPHEFKEIKEISIQNINRVAVHYASSNKGGVVAGLGFTESKLYGPKLVVHW